MGVGLPVIDGFANGATDGFSREGRSSVGVGFPVIVGFANGANDGFSSDPVGLLVTVGFSKGAKDGLVSSEAVGFEVTGLCDRSRGAKEG